MKQIIIVTGLLGLLLFTETLSQDNDALVKEVINFTQVNPGDTSEWEYANRRFYSYNSQRLPVYGQYQNWDKEAGQWGPIRTQWKYEYDGSGNRTYDWVVRYQTENTNEVEMKRETVRTYRGDLIIQYRRNFVDYIDIKKEEYVVNYTYDNEDRLTERYSEYRDNYNSRRTETVRKYYNDKGCLYADVDINITYLLEEPYGSLDSTYRHFSDNCDLKQIDYYSYDRKFDRYLLAYQYRIDKEYDEMDYLSKEINYERTSQYEPWRLFSILEYENTSDGKPASTFYHNLKNGYKSILTNEYNEDGQVILEMKQEWDTDINEYENAYEIKSSYHKDSILNYIIYRYGWNESMREFDYFFSSTFEFDEKDFLVKKTDRERKLNNYNGEKYLITVETNFNTRCDGETLSETSSEIEAVNVPSHYKGTKTVNTYYDNAPCNPEQAEVNNIKIYPNPSRGYVNVYNTETFGESTIEVLNRNGQTVYQDRTRLNNYFSIDLEDLPAGMYVLKIDNGIIRATGKFLLIN